jgi:mannose-6-phosphate isomerase-like protein (cupin superfamily)
MSGFTITNLRDVDDSAPKFGFGELQEARFARGALEAQDTGLAFHRVKPGQRQGFAHRHHQAEEIAVVVGGSGRVKIDDEVREIGPLDAIRIAPEHKRAFEAGSDGLEYLVFGPHHDSDGEIVQDEDFWADA